jgi:hypothetical protein
MTRTLLTANVHFNEDTRPSAEKVTDFVSLSIGDINLFLMNSGQALRLADAAMEALAILNEMEGKSTATDEMMTAGKTYINDIYKGQGGVSMVHDFSATLGWTLEDWQVVMKRHGSFMPSQKDVEKFQAKFEGSK